MATAAVTQTGVWVRLSGRWLREIPLTVTFAVGLALCDIAMTFLTTGQQLVVAHAASTNIVHLALDPLFVLPASAFVDLGLSWFWIPLALVLLGGLERKLGARRALLITFGGHVLATLLSEGMLLGQVMTQAKPFREIHMVDVGPSYVMLAALAACLVVGSWRLRIAAVVAGMIIIPGLLVGLDGFDMSAVGHLSALLLGTGFAFAYTRWIGREPLVERIEERIEGVTESLEGLKGLAGQLKPVRPAPARS